MSIFVIMMSLLACRYTMACSRTPKERPKFFLTTPDRLQEGVETSISVRVTGASENVPAYVELKNDGKVFFRRDIQCPPDKLTPAKVNVTMADVWNDAMKKANSHVWLVVRTASSYSGSPSAFQIKLEVHLRPRPIFLIAPNMIRVGVQETILVTVREVSQTIPVSIELKNNARTRTYYRRVWNCDKDIPTSVRVIVSFDDLREEFKSTENPYVWLIARSTSPYLGRPFSQEIQIMVTSRVGHVFLQLDKTIYNPRQKMDSRVYSIDQDMMPSNRKVRFEVKDPDGLKLLSEDKSPEADYPGIVQFKPFYFPQIATKGIWTASAYYGDQFQYKDEVQFEVRDYALPAFKVQVSHDQIITPSTGILTVKVKAKYTYGKYVRGMVNITCGLLYPPSKLVNVFTTTRQLSDGENEINLDTKEIEKLVWFPKVQALQMVVTVRVRERSTGEEEEGITFVKFDTSPIQITFDRTTKFFKPDLSFQVIVDVKHLVPLEESTIPVRIQTFDITKGGNRTPLDFFEDVTDLEPGINILSIDHMNTGTYFEVKVSTNYQEGDITNTEATLIVKKQESESPDSYIAIRVYKNNIKVGDLLEVEFRVPSSSTGKKELHFLALARGQIAFKGTKMMEGSYATMRFTVTTEMSPQAHLVVYYFKKKGERTIVVADSVLIRVEKTCKKDVELKIDTDGKTCQPGDYLYMDIKAAANSQVALVAVDQAVYLLREKGILQRDQMFDFLYNRHLGCTVGSGKNVASVFKDSGLAVLTNMGLTTARRDREFCQSGIQQRHRRSLITWDQPKCCQMGQYADDCRAGGMDLVMDGVSVDCVKTFYNCCIVANPRQDGIGALPYHGGRTGIHEITNEERFDIKDFDIKVNQHRLEFDESWFWEIKKTDKNGMSKNVFSMKHSITTWVFQGVAMSQNEGMCIARPLNITVFKHFFIKLDLPTSAVRGEQVEVKATLYNYANQIPVRMFLEGTDGVCSGPKIGEKGGERHFVIKANDAVSVSWPVIPLQEGGLKIKVHALVKTFSDIVEGKLVVIPSGKQQTEAITVKLNPAGLDHVNEVTNYTNRIKNILHKNENRQVLIIDTTKKLNFVAGSGKLILSFSGHLFGSIVEKLLTGLGDTMQLPLPTDCGEQTMSKLGPTLYTAHYLKKTRQMTSDLEKKAYEYVRKGVQHMKQYKEAFFPGGERNLWLTAYVVKVFSQAHEFNFFEFNDLDTICSRVKWICERQNTNGSFYEPTGGIYINPHYHDPATYTAFVLIALLEADCHLESQNAVKAAKEYLTSNVGHMKNSYSLAITTYALALANSPMKQKANTLLQNQSAYDAGLNARSWSSDSGKKAVAVETAGYALLAQIELNNIEYCHAIVNWLIMQRKSGGSFYSTQDTVIGLKALTEYYIHTKGTEPNMEITIQSDKKTSRPMEYLLTKTNYLLYKQFDLTEHIGHTLTVDVKGHGLAYMDFLMQYNTKLHGPQGEQQNCQFEMSIDIATCKVPTRVDEDKECLRITVTARYTGVQEAGMVMLDVGLFTGFVPRKKDLDLIKNTMGNKIPMYELTDRVVYFYVDQMAQNETVSVSFDMEQTSNVGNVQPVPVTVYRYYEPDVSCTKFYHPEGHNHLLSYDCRDETCTCLSGECATCYGNKEDHQDSHPSVLRYSPPLDYGSMNIKACYGENFDYVVIATVVDSDHTQHVDLENITAIVDIVGKNGSDKTVIAGNNIYLAKGINCDCPHLEIGKTYLIMGMDGVRKTLPGGNTQFLYYIDSQTYVTEYVPYEYVDNKKITSQQRRFIMKLSRKGCDN